MMPVRLGAVSYLNARPCVVGLDRDPRFDLRFDLPSRCAALLHDGAIDVGLVPSIEYLRGPNGAGGYCIVPEVAIASDGPVASVALYTKRPMTEVQSIALDTSSRTSVALTRVLCSRVWHIDPVFEPSGPDLTAMLERCDAGLLIGDAALFAAPGNVLEPERAEARPTSRADDRKVRLTEDRRLASAATVIDRTTAPPVEKIDLGATWTHATGLPFVYAFWAGPPGSLTADQVSALHAARDAGVDDPGRVAREYLTDPAECARGARYLRDNIKYHLGERERAGLEIFYRYAAELGLVPQPHGLRFY